MSSSPIFYDRFERHAHAQGLKAHATHYCAGCGHGIAHKFVAEAIEKLGIQDDTVMVSPVGCSVFLFYYFDTGNTQAAHGRAPAVAIGHKVANPDATVIAYQGDGDLASIGIAEIISAAQMGLPLSIVFINNAIYGMTGGQMAPTTLMGQKTATSPFGRNQMMGQPSKMAELIAQLDGSIYVERVALFDAKQRMRAKKAIEKAIRLQVEKKGFSFVEVLAECPTHLKCTPEEAEKWVKEQMLPIFPLGVKKDTNPEPWFSMKKPSFEAARMIEVLDASTEERARFCKGFPKHIAPHDVSLKLAGSGGDGAQTAAMLIAYAGINEGFDATHIPSYGPESRGGTSYADVHVAAEEVLSPSAKKPNVLIAFNAPSLAKFAGDVRENGTIVYDSSVIRDVPPVAKGVKVVGVPFTGIANEIGKLVVKNIVALGALQAATGIFPKETFLTAIRQALKDKAKLIPMNEQAFARGVAAVGAVAAPAPQA